MRCVLVSTTADNEEIRSLIASAGHEIVEEFVQKRTKPDSRYYIGSGKAKEIKRFLHGGGKERDEETGSDTADDLDQEDWTDPGVECVVFNAVLKPSHHCMLERTLGVQVWDRLWLILEIFKERAHSKEAMLQVELARRRYEIPLLKEWVHRARKGEHPGYMAGGAYEVDQYLEFARKRERLLKKKLESMEKQRELRRSSRRDREVHMVSLAGYTNSGKSTLLRSVTGENVVVEDRMFSTLATTTRRIPGTGKRILLTDTVGFIHDLPPWLIDAFRSTLEEVFQADTVLLFLDASEPPDVMMKKLETCDYILLPDARASSILMVANKIDMISGEELDEKLKILNTGGRPVFPVSAKMGFGLEELVDEIVLKHAFPVQMKIMVNEYERERIHQIYENTVVLDRVDVEGGFRMRIACTERDAAALKDIAIE